MERLNGQDYFRDNEPCLPLRHALPFLLFHEHPAEVTALAVLEDKEQFCVVLEALLQIHDERVRRNLRKNFLLAPDELQDVVLVNQLLVLNLDRRELACKNVLGQEHFSKGSRAQVINKLVILYDEVIF